MARDLHGGIRYGRRQVWKNVLIFSTTRTISTSSLQSCLTYGVVQQEGIPYDKAIQALYTAIGECRLSCT